MARDTPSPELLVYLNHVCLPAGVPKKEPSYKMGKNIRSLSTEPYADRGPT